MGLAYLHSACMPALYWHRAKVIFIIRETWKATSGKVDQWREKNVLLEVNQTSKRDLFERR